MRPSNVLAGPALSGLAQASARMVKQLSQFLSRGMPLKSAAASAASAVDASAARPSAGLPPSRP